MMKKDKWEENGDFKEKRKKERSGRGCVKAEHLISLDTERKWSCLGSIMQAVTSGGGARLKGWMSLSLTNPIKSSAALLRAHAHVHTVLRKGPGQDNPFIHTDSTHTQHIKQNVMRKGAAILVMKLKSHPHKWKERGLEIKSRGSALSPLSLPSSVAPCSRLLGSGGSD